MSLLKKQELKNNIGWDGIITFIISNILMVLSLGLSLAWFYLKVYKMAKQASTDIIEKDAKFIIVLGVKLNNDIINNDFKLRLDKAIQILKNYKNKFHILVLGGITHNNTKSEAMAGATYLVEFNIDKNNISLEEKSKHTLDNLRNVRDIIGKNKTIMISNRYHLYRSCLLAKGLNLNVVPIAAEHQFYFITADFINFIKEAYFVHWYIVGKLFVAISKNKKSKKRIS